MASSARGVNAAAKGLIDFINKSPSPWHAVEQCKKRLAAAGFQELKEADNWNIKPLQKYYVTRNMSTIVAFAVGGAYKPGNGFSIVGAHTDSPCLRVKPVSKKEAHGYLQVGVELYGGGLWLTWFDRDLGIAGRVMVKQDGKLQNRLINVNRPLLRVPHLCIHLKRDTNEKFSPNMETEVCPVLATSAEQALTGVPSDCEGGQCAKHQPLLMKVIADELGVEPSAISDFELCLADCVPSTVGGVLNEFVFAPRLDNLFNVYTGMEALIASTKEPHPKFSSDPCVRVASFFDHEEIGSTSAQGADSVFQSYVLQRLCAGGSATAFQESIPKSYLISADQAHAVHPNYPDKHEANHRPSLHGGIVLKFNCKQRYATNAWTASVLREIADRAEVPLQDFVVRNDSACGSTIGPIMAAKLAIPTIDIGGAQLSMHSIREQCSTSSVQQSIDLYTSFYENFAEVRDMVQID